MPPEATTKTMGEALCLVPSGPQCARDRGGALDPFDFPPLEEVEPQRKFYSISDRLHVRIDRVDSRNNSSSPQPSIVFKRAGLAGLDTVCYAMPMIMLTYANDNSTDPSFWAYIVDLGTVTDGHDCEIYRCDGLREGIHWWGHLSFVAYLPF